MKTMPTISRIDNTSTSELPVSDDESIQEDTATVNKRYVSRAEVCKTDESLRGRDKRISMKLKKCFMRGYLGDRVMN